MAQIIGQIDSLTRLLNIFEENRINLFKSLKDIYDFKNNYADIVEKKHSEVIESLKKEIERSKYSLTEATNYYNEQLSEREEILLKEKGDIYTRIEQYSKASENIIKKLYYKYKIFILNKRKYILENDFENEKKKPFKETKKRIAIQDEKLSYLENNFDEVVQERFKVIENEYIKAKSLLDEYNSIYLGAIGEYKAVEVLKELPDSYYILNDFQLHFRRTIYHKETGNYIKSVQADHIVIGPTGVFLIETKFWSQNSINSRNLYSPVEQIKRTNFALFIYLNNPDNYKNSFLSHHWGNRKVSIHSIILMINAKPQQEFQYVKILSLHEIIGYIQYFKPVFSDTDVKAIYRLLS